MTKELESKKLEAQRMRVIAARFELECRVMELREEIIRIETNIDIQKKAESELNEKLTSLKGESK